jgi:TPR repeat protein
MRLRPLLLAAFLTLSLAGCGKNGSAVSGSSSSSVAPRESAAQMEAKAAKGDKEAMFNLGAMYHDGDGAPKDLAKAVEWFQKGADAGERKSQFNLGLMYYKGEGVTQDYAKAATLFSHSSDLGNGRAAYQLGLMEYLGQGVGKDLVKARSDFELGARRGIPDAQYNLGVMLAKGEGGAQDAIEAFAWLSISDGMGFTRAGDAKNRLSERFSDDQKKAAARRTLELGLELQANGAVN